MCFRFASCIGVHVRDDDVLYVPAPPSKAMPPPAPRHAGATKTPVPAPRYVDSNAADKAGRRTRRPSPASPAPAAVAALAGGPGFAAGAGERPAAARNNSKVVEHGVGNGAHHQYRCDEHEQPDREEGNKDCYPTMTAAGDHERC